MRSVLPKVISESNLRTIMTIRERFLERSSAQTRESDRLALRTKRAQGRPPRGSEDAGREKLLEGARIFLRSRIDHSVSQQEIARAARVTPALISYYFESKTELLLSATLPVVREAVGKLESILDGEGSYTDRLKQLVSLFIGFSAKNGRILDIFIEAALESKSTESQALILAPFDKMQRFFAGGAKAREWRAFDPTFFIFAVWGMCKFVGEPPAFPIRMFAPDMKEEELWQLQAGLIVQLLLQGIKDQMPETRPSA